MGFLESHDLDGFGQDIGPGRKVHVSFLGKNLACPSHVQAEAEFVEVVHFVDIDLAPFHALGQEIDHVNLQFLRCRRQGLVLFGGLRFRFGLWLGFWLGFLRLLFGLGHHLGAGFGGGGAGLGGRRLARRLFCRPLFSCPILGHSPPAQKPDNKLRRLGLLQLYPPHGSDGQSRKANQEDDNEGADQQVGFHTADEANAE